MQIKQYHKGKSRHEGVNETFDCFFFAGKIFKMVLQIKSIPARCIRKQDTLENY